MATAKVGAKKSLFKKPAWASASTENAGKDNDRIFGHAHLYQEIVQQEKERRERSIAKQKEREERDARRGTERESKRRRISKEAEDSDNGSDSEVESNRSGSVASESDQKSNASTHEEETVRIRNTPKRRTRRDDGDDTSRSCQTRSQNAQSAAHDEAVVLIDDDDGPIEVYVRRSSPSLAPQPKQTRILPKAKQPEPESESEEDDEYLRELKAKARQEARAKSQGRGESTAGSPAPYSTGHPNARSSSREASNAPSSSNTNDPEVKIWIKTLIPSAKEVIVSRRINQPLDKVKEFWIKRNAIEPGLAERVFFTWNGTRLYNSSTMRGIIERLKLTHPLRDGSGGDPSHGQIVIEAVTEEIFEYRQKQRARRLAEAAEGYSGADGDGHDDGDTSATQQQRDGGGEDAQQQQPKPVGIVIKLRAQGLEEMSLRVRPHTTMRKILSGFCRVREVDPSMQTWLSYDGDRLDEETTVEQIGFEHEDTVEVYLRPAAS